MAKSRYPVRLGEGEERELRRRVGQYTRPHREVVQAKVVLLAADGLIDREIAERLDCSEATVFKWRKRFFEEGLAGLDERPRPGRPRVFSSRRDRRGEGARLRAAGDLRQAA
jgi:DNA-directed RNA polymerase specialized sigma24 family protein